MKKKQPRNNPMTCNHYQQTALIEPRGTYWFSWKRSRESWKSLQSFLPTWTSCPSIWGFKIPPHIPPARCDTKYSLMPPLSRVPCTYGAPLTFSIPQLWLYSENLSLTGVCHVVQSSPRFVDQQRGSGAHSPDLLPFTPMCRIFHRGLCEGHGFCWLSSQGLATEGDPIRQINT